MLIRDGRVMLEISLSGANARATVNLGSGGKYGAGDVLPIVLNPDATLTVPGTAGPKKVAAQGPIQLEIAKAGKSVRISVNGTLQQTVENQGRDLGIKLELVGSGSELRVSKLRLDSPAVP
jgi:hypothetical protein